MSIFNFYYRHKVRDNLDTLNAADMSLKVITNRLKQSIAPCFVRMQKSKESLPDDDLKKFQKYYETGMNENASFGKRYAFLHDALNLFKQNKIKLNFDDLLNTSKFDLVKYVFLKQMHNRLANQINSDINKHNLNMPKINLISNKKDGIEVHVVKSEDEAKKIKSKQTSRLDISKEHKNDF